jgi:hypothetical protein
MLTDSVVVFTNYSNEVHANELQDMFNRHVDKISMQWSEYRISGGLSDSTKYYSGILVAGIRKKADKAANNK